jgi:drug/metabolite transporter (DMT)-like permease
VHRPAIVVALLVMVIWGATPVATRLATEELEPLTVGVMRTVLAGLIAVPLIAGMRLPPPATDRARRLLAVSALAGFVVFPLIYTFGQERTSAMHGGVILAALPVFTGLWAALAERRRPRAWWLAGCAVALAGEFVVIAFRSGGGGGAAASLAGDLLVLLAAILVSSGYVAGARLAAGGYRSIATTFWGVALGAVLVAPIAVVGGAVGGTPGGDLTAWGAVLFLAVVTSIVGYIGWYWALDRGTVARIAPMQFLQPLSGLLLAALFLDERLTAPLAIGAAAVLVGVAIAQRPPAAVRRGDPAPTPPP